ncbi:uncharacterized protein LOC126373425 [Pectinophora gossypiella]|uniref:uncharacterized protein LOC126373425 n=1 Tax=Pectinophora gossypiella TaxID=13191 RepID=UPI00214EA63E|nr:uncharacterized protein LOC126373425 [Pectinophora gossypiella]
MYAAPTVVTAFLLLAGTTSCEAQTRELRPPMDLLRLLAEKPWIGLGPHHRWDRPPQIDADLGPKDLEIVSEMDNDGFGRGLNMDDLIRTGADKRSAVATALNAGRRRRQPTPALGVLNDMGTFFDALRDNLETFASLTPEQRASLFQAPPTVVQAPSSGGGGGGSGIRKLHALRPLRPTGNIRSYNRRSFVEADGGYPGANHHDPGLLWTGLGR